MTPADDRWQLLSEARAAPLRRTSEAARPRIQPSRAQRHGKASWWLDLSEKALGRVPEMIAMNRIDSKQEEDHG